VIIKECNEETLFEKQKAMTRKAGMRSKDKICILAFSGSLRKNSHNSAVLRAAKQIALSNEVANVEVVIFDRIGEFPLFNPDLGDGESIEVIRDFRRALTASDAVLIASPEYVHGVSGPLKNALDWVVGSGEFDQKPVGLIHVTPSANGATWVRDSLTEIMNVMSAKNVVSEASFVISEAKKKFDEQGNLMDQAERKRLEEALKVLAKRHQR
jgi:chromate reductase